MRIAFSGWLLAVVATASQTACVKPQPSAQVFGLGEKVQVGPLIYSVFDAEWSPQIGRGEQARLPSQRFLTIHLTVTNGGAETLAVPSLRLLDEAGHLYSESMDGQNVTSWLGMIRNVKPVETLEGNILFDVEPKSYKLKLNDDADAGRPALVEMPLRFGLDRPAVPSALDRPPQ